MTVKGYDSDGLPWQQLVTREDGIGFFIMDIGRLYWRAQSGGGPSVVDYIHTWPDMDGVAGTAPGVGPRAGDDVPDYIRRLIGTGLVHVFDHEYKRMFWEVFTEISHPHVELWWKFPDDQERSRLTPDLGMPSVAAALANTTDYGYLLRGKDSFWNQGTGRGKFYVLYKQDHKQALFNRAAQAVNGAKTRYHINRVPFEPLHPEQKEDARLILQMTKRQVKRKAWIPGPEGWFYAHDFREVFGVDPVIWKRFKQPTKLPDGKTTTGLLVAYKSEDGEVKPLGEG